eukprot:6188870-Pleurochrysis_carterae.AAC.2
MKTTKRFSADYSFRRWRLLYLHSLRMVMHGNMLFYNFMQPRLERILFERELPRCVLCCSACVVHVLISSAPLKNWWQRPQHRPDGFAIASSFSFARKI